jgi:hypothetical protein
VALVALFFAAASALYTFPLVFNLRTALMVGAGDYLGEASLVAWNARQLVRDPLRLFDTQFYYPHSNTIAYGQSLFFPGLLAIPGFWLTSDPLAVTNGLLLLALWLSGLTMYGLAFFLTGRVGPSLLAGIVFAYFPNRMDHLGQFTVQMGFLLPLVTWAFARFLLERTWRHLALVVLGLWGQVLSTMYHAYALALLLAALAVACLLLRPGILTWPLAARGTLGLMALGLALAPFLAPYLALHRELGLARTLQEAELYGMTLWSFLDPGVFSTLYGGRLLFSKRPEGGLFPGFVVLALAGVAGLARAPAEAPGPSPRWVRLAGRMLLAALVVALALIVAVPWTGGLSVRPGSWTLLSIRHVTLPLMLLPVLALTRVALQARHRRSGPLTPREWALVLVFLTVLMYLLTLAPTIRIGGHAWGTAPFRWVFAYLPGGSAFRAPGRWSLVFVVPLALLAALGAAAVAERLGGRRARVVLAGLLLGVMVEYLDLPIPWSHQPAPPPVYGWLGDQPGDFAIFELPFQRAPFDAWYQYWQTVHGKRLVNGAVGFEPATIRELAEDFTSRAMDRAVARLRAIYPLRYLIVHRALAGRGEPRGLEALRSTPVPGLRFVTAVGSDDVYAVEATPEAGPEVSRYFSVDYVRRHPEARFTVRMPRVPEISQWVEVAFNGRVVARVETEETRTLRLGPPFSIADRNELRFRRRYEVRWDVVDDRTAYRIGRTGTVSPVDIEVRSAGRQQGNAASIRINGVEQSPDRRGYNLVVLDPATGRVRDAVAFDTFRSADESRRLASFVEALPPRTLVVAAVRDDGGGRLTSEAVRALRSLGGRVDTTRTLFLSHLLVGVKGAHPGEALEAAAPHAVEALVGASRPGTITLQSFELD